MALWLRVVLFASLALNLAVAGVVVGGVLHGAPGWDHGPPRGRDFVTPYTRAFTEEERHEIGARLREEFRRDRPDRGGFVAGYRRGLEALRAEPFSAGAFAETLEAQGEEAERRQEVGQDVLVGYVAAMSPEARAAYADRLEEQLDWFQERFEKHRHGDRD